MLNFSDEFKKHLLEQFKDNGERAVNYIESAEWLIQNINHVEIKNAAEILAYCLREALDSIVDSSKTLEENRWRDITTEINENYDSYKSAKGKPGEPLSEFLGVLEKSLENLQIFKNGQRKNTYLLSSLFLTQTGSDPFNPGAIKKFADVLDEASRALHSSATIDEIVQLWERGIDALKLLFSPYEERKLLITQLAREINPSGGDLEELELIIATPHQAGIFFNEVSDIQWIDLLKDHWLINEVGDSEFWPFMVAIEKYSHTNPQEILDILVKLYDKKSVPNKFVLKGAMHLLPLSHSLVAEIVRKEVSNPEIVWLAAFRLEDLNDESDLVFDLCDYLLNPKAMESIRYLEPLVKKIISNSNVSNYERNLGTVVNKIRNLQKSSNFTFLKVNRNGLIAENLDFLFRDYMADLMRLLLGIILKMDSEIKVATLLKILEPLPIDIKHRVESWYLSFGNDVTFLDLRNHILMAVSSRYPNGDDVAMVERLKGLAAKEELVNLVDEIFEPISEQMELITTTENWNDLDSTFKYRFQWTTFFSETIDESWRDFIRESPIPVSGATPNELVMPIQGGFTSGRSPISQDELLKLNVPQACEVIRAWRPGQNDFLISALELARTLMHVVELNGQLWVTDPLTICRNLAHPTYIHFYLEGILKHLESSKLTEVENWVVALREIYTWKHEPEALGTRDGYSYEEDWQGVRAAIIRVFKFFLDRDYDLSGHLPEIRDIFLAASSDVDSDSHISGDGIDALTRAINRSSTKATEALISYMAYLSRSNREVDEVCFEHLEALFRLENENGLQYRAIILQRIEFLHFVSPDWFSEIVPAIFRTSDKNDLAFKSFAVTLKMMPRVQDWFLEMFNEEIYGHARAGSSRAMDFLLIGMLREIKGYESNKVVSHITRNHNAALKCGESLGRLLSLPETNQEFTEKALELWDKLIKVAELPAEFYYGFGWMSEVGALDIDKWKDLTLRTLKRSDGRVDWIHGISERLQKNEIDTRTLEIVFLLLCSKSQNWEKYQVAELGIYTLSQSDHLNATPEYSRLKTALQERGFIA